MSGDDRGDGTNESGSRLQLRISSASETRYDSDTVPVRVTFENRDDDPVSVLDAFEPLPVFFSFRLVNPDGTPVSLPGAGKVDFGPQTPGRVELAPGETLSRTVDLASLLTEPLPPGRYSVSTTYHNQYGEDCFTGRLDSNTIEIDIE